MLRSRQPRQLNETVSSTLHIHHCGQHITSSLHKLLLPMWRPFGLANSRQGIAGELAVTYGLSVHFKAIAQLTKLQHRLLVMDIRGCPGNWRNGLINTRGDGANRIVNAVTIAMPTVKTLDVDIEAVAQRSEALCFHLPRRRIHLSFCFPG
ncbi:hypothetical protein D3C80_1189710 [compost metagenome]